MIGNSIRNYRIMAGLNQGQLADLIRVKNYTIGDWERGRAEPSCEDVQKLCVALDISADELFEIDTPERRKKIEQMIR